MQALSQHHEQPSTGDSKKETESKTLLVQQQLRVCEVKNADKKHCGLTMLEMEQEGLTPK